MKILNRLIISAVIGIIGTILNNQYLLSKKLTNDNLILEEYWVTNLDKIKNTTELNIIEKKLKNYITVFNKEIKKIPECNDAKNIQLNINTDLLITFTLVWIKIDYESMFKCQKIYQKKLSDLLNSPEINLEAKILTMATSENKIYISSLTPYLLFLVLFGATFVFFGIRTK